MSALIVAIHDVAPDTFESCAALVKTLEKIGPVRFSLLVVPFYHRHHFISQNTVFLRWLRKREQLGDEIVLHGFTHTDDQTVRWPWDRLKRRVYTHGEGEFAALTDAQARARLAFAKNCLNSLDFSPKGFVAPAWLFPSSLLTILPEYGFSYTTTLRKLITLPGKNTVPLPTIVYSTRSAWRKHMSRIYNQIRYFSAKESLFLRIALHPGDVDTTILTHSQYILTKALEKRPSLTKYEVALQCGAAISSSLSYR